MYINYDKLHKDIRRDSANKVATDIRNKEIAEKYVKQDPRNKEVYERGIEWFNSGLTLEDAPEEFRNNTNFINGYKKGERLALIASLQEKDIKKCGR